MAPRREVGNVQVRDRSETDRDHVQVARVAAERDGVARGPLQRVELPVD